MPKAKVPVHVLPDSFDLALVEAISDVLDLNRVCHVLESEGLASPDAGPRVARMLGRAVPVVYPEVAFHLHVGVIALEGALAFALVLLSSTYRAGGVDIEVDLSDGVRRPERGSGCRHGTGNSPWRNGKDENGVKCGL